MSSNTTPDAQNDGPTYEDLREEFIAVRARIRELELSNDAAERRIAELEREKTNTELVEGAVAVCAWHAHHGHPPAQSVQPGYLECGCTIQEALFEESMARHGVGSIYPEGPMMDPALRKPLLQLLQRRYNYADGSLEHAQELMQDQDQDRVEEDEEEEGNFILAPSKRGNVVPDPAVGPAITAQA